MKHPGVSISTEAGRAVLVISGHWRRVVELPAVAELDELLATPAPPSRLVLRAAELGAWDSGLIAVVASVVRRARSAGMEVELSELPEGVRDLARLALAVPEKQGARRHTHRSSVLARIGDSLLEWLGAATGVLAFVGDAVLSLGRLCVGRAQMRFGDFLLVVQECGAQALPIVTLISVLVGMILAFVGSVQLEQFGAEIYVADLVALGMAREMGAMMTAIIMSGRTGAAFAAQLGTMKVNEEIDALTTMGIAPMDFLVLPRLLALVAMMPLLCVYSDALGILGGAFVGVTMLDLSANAYLDETWRSVGLISFQIGVVKAAIFGVIVAVCGCMQGIRCGDNAAAVGKATTSAVVSSIVWIVVADALVTIVCNVLEI
jgi:phospholipid/cholesterol/gamma-HCH transport system permease protein